MKLHIDPAQLEGAPLPESKAEAIVGVLHEYALIAGKTPCAAFCLLLSALGRFCERTDAPAELIATAIGALSDGLAEMMADCDAGPRSVRSTGAPS